MKTIRAADLTTDVLSSAIPVLAVFSTPHCAPCREMMPRIDEIAAEYAETLRACKIDATVDPELAASFHITAVPTLLLFQAGRVIGQLTGGQSKQAVLRWITSHLGSTDAGAPAPKPDLATAPTDGDPAAPIPSIPGFSRREFLWRGASLLPLAGAAAGGGPVVRGAEASGDPTQPIDPGYVGPQFFDADEREALTEVIESGSPFRYWGPGRPTRVRQFEEAFAARMGTRFALGVTSGTAALDCAVAALGIGPGDEVILPAYTWWSDYTCVVHAGALPVFAEMDRTLNLDPEDFARRITPRTRAVIVVHLLGGPADLEPILATARQHGIRVIEDCAQCVGGSFRGAPLGSLGDIGIYSFQINKTMTTGEGGALVTNDPRLYERAARFHDMGNLNGLFQQRLGGSQEGHFPGENFRMSELTGAVAGAQLPKLTAMIRELRRHATAIAEGIHDLPGLRLRRQPDPAGDIGYGVCFELPNRAQRDRCIENLRRRHVPASTLTGSVLLPVQESVIQKRTRHPAWPSFTSEEGRALRYGPEACPQTLELFDRFVQVRIGARYTARIDDYIIAQVRQAWEELV